MYFQLSVKIEIIWKYISMSVLTHIKKNVRYLNKDTSIEGFDE